MGLITTVRAFPFRQKFWMPGTPYRNIPLNFFLMLHSYSTAPFRFQSLFIYRNNYNRIFLPSHSVGKQTFAPRAAIGCTTDIQERCTWSQTVGSLYHSNSPGSEALTGSGSICLHKLAVTRREEDQTVWQMGTV